MHEHGHGLGRSIRRESRSVVELWFVECVCLNFADLVR